MTNLLEQMRQEANHTRYRLGQSAGHYESFFLRANHPSRPLAFWIRYTLFSPDHHPENAIGELWAVCFDGETQQKAKSLVGLPMAVFNGLLTVDGKDIGVENWGGSQNHNWGAKHTDLYAWGQVAGFDNHPDSFLEVATARLKIGPLWTPPMTPMVLRHRGEEIALNNLMQTLRARGSFRYFEWAFQSETHDVRLEGKIVAPREAFVGLNYSNPPGGNKHCLNTKIATCELKLIHKHQGKTSDPEILSTQHRAAFEILTDDRDHGVEIQT